MRTESNFREIPSVTWLNILRPLAFSSPLHTADSHSPCCQTENCRFDQSPIATLVDRIYQLEISDRVVDQQFNFPIDSTSFLQFDHETTTSNLFFWLSSSDCQINQCSEFSLTFKLASSSVFIRQTQKENASTTTDKDCSWRISSVWRSLI